MRFVCSALIVFRVIQNEFFVSYLTQIHYRTVAYILGIDSTYQLIDKTTFIQIIIIIITSR